MDCQVQVLFVSDLGVGGVRYLTVSGEGVSSPTPIKAGSLEAGALSFKVGGEGGGGVEVEGAGEVPRGWLWPRFPRSSGKRGQCWRGLWLQDW